MNYIPPAFEDRKCQRCSNSMLSSELQKIHYFESIEFSYRSEVTVIFKDEEGNALEICRACAQEIAQQT